MMTKDTIELTISESNWERASILIQNLTEEGYVVMVSKEEDLIVLNLIETFVNYEPFADRNEVVFMPVEEFENKYVEFDKNSDDCACSEHDIVTHPQE